MTDETDRQAKESPLVDLSINNPLLVAVSVKEGTTTTLITPNARYTFDERGLSTIQEIKDYSSEVKDIFTRVAKRASGIYNTQEILIQVKYVPKKFDQ